MFYLHCNKQTKQQNQHRNAGQRQCIGRNAGSGNILPHCLSATHTSKHSGRRKTGSLNVINRNLLFFFADRNFADIYYNIFIVDIPDSRSGYDPSRLSAINTTLCIFCKSGCPPSSFSRSALSEVLSKFCDFIQINLEHNKTHFSDTFVII